MSKGEKHQQILKSLPIWSGLAINPAKVLFIPMKMLAITIAVPAPFTRHTNNWPA